MSVTLTAMQDAIKKTAIVGVKRIYTNADAPKELFARDLPAIIPDPSKPIESSGNQRQTLAATVGNRWGSGWVRTRTLNYVCLVSELGADRRPSASGEKLAQLLDAVENAFCDFRMDGVHNVLSVTIADVGILQDAVSAAVDPARAKQFHGFTAQLTVVMSY